MQMPQSYRFVRYPAGEVMRFGVIRCESCLAPYAAEAAGTIKSIDMSKHTVTLDNGSTYDVAKDVQVNGTRIGERVTLTYQQSGKAMDATAIKPAA